MQQMMHDTIEKNVSLMYSDEFIPPLTNKVLLSHASETLEIGQNTLCELVW